MVRCKKALSLVLALVMMLGMIPFNMNANAEASYTITWKSKDGSTILYTTTVAEGESYTYKGVSQDTDYSDPTQKLYFAGWDDGTGTRYYSSFPTAKSTVTYTAVYESANRVYTVAFVDENGTELKRSVFDYGTDASYVVDAAPEAPAKASDARYDYKFAGWQNADGSGDIGKVTSNAVYLPTYTAETREHTITWLDENGDVLATTSCKYGDTPVYPNADPTKAEGVNFIFTFTGWTPAVSAVTGDKTYTATFGRTLKTPNADFRYTVRWMNENGTVFAKNDLKAGITPVPPSTTPKKASDERYTYTFAGWEPEIAAVSTDAVYTAKFNATPRTFDLKYTYGKDKDHIDEVLETASGVLRDSIPEYSGDVNALTKKTTEGDYIFAGWLTSVDTAGGVITRAAKYVTVKNEYPVAFVNWDGEVLQVGLTEYGTIPTPPATEPTRENTPNTKYIFIGWTPSLTTVLGGTVYTANYKEIKKYTITWRDGDEKVLYSVEVDADEVPAYSGATPTKKYEGIDADKLMYSFTGWDPTPYAADRDQDYKAQFEIVPSSYEITYRFIVWETQETLDDDKTSVEKYGDIPSYDAPQTIEKGGVTYTFIGWDKLFNNVWGKETYTARYTSGPDKLYTAHFIDGDGFEPHTDVIPKDNVPGFNMGGYEPEKKAEPDRKYRFGKVLARDTEGNPTSIQYWDPEPAPLSGSTADVVYTAQFTTLYKINWVNWDEEPLCEPEYWDEGTTPVYSGPTPTKPHPNPTVYHYDWNPEVWEPAITEVDGPATYKATFVEKLNQYNITWEFPDPDDQSDQPPYVQVAPADQPLVKPSDDKVPDEYPKWVEKGTDPDDPNNYYNPANPPTKNVTYVPVFNITWDDPAKPADEDVVKKVPYQEPVTKPDAPEVPDYPNWVDENGKPYTPHDATKDETFKPALNITWEFPDEKGDPLPSIEQKDQPYDKLEKPNTLPDHVKDKTWVEKPDPAKPDDPLVPFDPSNPPTKDTTYVPVFDITWDNPTDNPVDVVDKVPYNKTVTKPGDDKLEDAVENKPWTEKDDPVNTPFAEHPATKDETYVPLYTITWDPNNTTDPIKTEQVKQGVTPVYDDTDPNKTPTKSGYNFKNWDPKFEPDPANKPYPANKDETYTAQYTPRSSGGGGGGDPTPVKSTVPITWDVDGTKTVTNVPKGDMPKYPNGTPTKDNAIFVRWTPEIVPADQPATYKAVFTDSPDYHARPDETGIDKVLETGEHVIYYRGYPDGTIQPYGNITRGETAMILYRLLLDKNVKITKSFTDVPEDGWYTTAVLTLASLGIVSGSPDGSFRPNEAITRAEFTAMCIRFVKAQEARFTFTDVDEKFWAYKEIMTAAYYGWITGYPDGTFRPNAFIARCEAAAVVNRMLGRVADQDYVTKHEKELIYFPDLLKEWYYYEMIEGTNAHDYDIVNEKETWKTMYDK